MMIGSWKVEVGRLSWGGIFSATVRLEQLSPDHDTGTVVVRSLASIAKAISHGERGQGSLPARAKPGADRAGAADVIGQAVGGERQRPGRQWSHLDVAGCLRGRQAGLDHIDELLVHIEDLDEGVAVQGECAQITD